MPFSRVYGRISTALMEWFLVARRDLPWRRTRDPYALWVSEVMLQQTQVPTVVPYYERFLARFPTVEALADADLGEVLAMWQGLGYYARARNLHAAARIIRDELGGRFPEDVAGLRALPGVGEYIAAAIASMAYDVPEPSVDSNVARVIARVFNVAEDPTHAAVWRLIRRHARALLDPERPGLSNQAIMELGAVICVPRKPLCPRCPIAAYCEARALGIQEERPVRRARAEIPHRDLVAALIARGEGLLLVRRVPSGLLGGLWELPGGEVRTDEDPPTALARILEQDLGVRAQIGDIVATTARAYSHFRATTEVFRCAITGEPVPSGPWDQTRWVGPGEHVGHALTGATLDALRAAGWKLEAG